MSKSTAPGKHCSSKSHLSPSQLTRQPIHGKAEEKEEDYCDEEIEPCSPESLYPSEDLQEVKRPTVQKKSERHQKGLPCKQSVKSEEEASRFGDFCSLKNILFLLCIVVPFFAYYIFQPEKPVADGATLAEFISDMKYKFKGQDHQTFQILKSSLKSVFNENSKTAAPSVVTIITNKGAEMTASDFSLYIAQQLSSQHYVSINESVLHGNPENLKYVIDNKIKSEFDNRSLNVAVVDRFHNIPIDAAMIFHSYCDHENAPFKRAIFLFIVHLNKIPDNPSKSIDEAAMQALRHIWRDASDDMVDSLITRLTVSVINIK